MLRVPAIPHLIFRSVLFILFSRAGMGLNPTFVVSPGHFLVGPGSVVAPENVLGPGRGSLLPNLVRYGITLGKTKT